jgi:hypothetical protein
MNQPSYGIIGNGRVARHFSHYFKQLNIPVLNWSRRENTLEADQDRLKSCDYLLLLISDGSIVPFFKENQIWLKNKAIHFSGSLSHPKIFGFHPLMTFSKEFYDLQVYQQIPFIGESGGPKFEDLFPQLPNPSFVIPSGDKAYYHALCVMAGNYTTLLWQKFFFELMTRWNLPHQVGHLYLKQIVANLISDPSTALTGPLKRNDIETLSKNRAALKNDRFLKVYESFMEAYDPT